MPSSASTDIAPTTLAVRRAARRSSSVSAPTAVICCVPLSSARPSLASSVERLEAAPSQRLGAAHGLAVDLGLAAADQRQREVRQRREIAGGADGTLLGHDADGCPARRKSSSRSTIIGRQPLWPRASVLARSSSIARTDLGRAAAQRRRRG